MRAQLFAISITLFATILHGALAAEPPTHGSKSWTSYENDEFGFSLKHPPGSRIIKPRRDTGREIRIVLGRYEVSTGEGGLKPGEYWLEIFIFDRKPGRTLWLPCDKLILKPIIEQRNGVRIFRGRPAHAIPDDVGGDMSMLCANGRTYDIHIQGAEIESGTPTVNAVLDTFKLTR